MSPIVPFGVTFQRANLTAGSLVRALLRPATGVLAAAILMLAAIALRAETLPAPGVPSGMVEAGVPAFVVLGPEAIGLSSPPTDMHVLRDGRILLFARNELAIGDGQRWEVVRKATDGGDELDDGSDIRGVALDEDGTIYVGIRRGFARVDFGEDGFWRLRRVAPYPPTDVTAFPVLTKVTMTDAGWFWHSLSGMIVRWKPGTQARVVDTTSSVDRVFTALGGTYMCNPLTRTLDFFGTGAAPLEAARAIMPMEWSIACSAPLDPGHALIGTSADGMKIFDGKTLRPFVERGPLSGEQWINDLCETEPGLYVAALHTSGLVFFDRNGRIIQVLDRTMDRRLARVERVLYSGGIVWALLRDGLARLQFPARMLERQGYRVIEADSAATAIRRFEEHGAPIDLLFTDLVMPGGVTGGQLAEELGKRQPGLKVIFTSGYSNEIIYRQLRLDADRNFIAKPCSAFELAAAVRRKLDEV